MKMIIVIAVALIGLLGLNIMSFTPAYAQDAKEAVCESLGAASNGSDCTEPAGSPSIMGAVGAALNILSIVAGIIAVIMIIIGGLKYITSQGDSQATSGARNTIIYAAVGLIIVALSQIIVRFVIDQV